ncbi:MAG: hypothetical protein H6711_12135 [Myxococcales bacterium]|nr:hypothetical protein [Myxococcales bacterium]
MSLKSAPVPRLPRDRLASGVSLIVRPDLLRSTLVARVEGVEIAEAVALLEGASVALAEALGRALPGARLRPLGFDLAAEGKSKSREVDPHVASLTGVIEIPLATELGFWDRARTVAALATITQAAVARGRSLRPPVIAVFGAPQASLRDPERHRGALIERWLGRARELTALAEARGLSGGLRLAAMATPGAVQQRPISLEEVELELDIDPPLEPTPVAEVAAASEPRDGGIVG